MRPERLELPTACSEDKCSVQLSYGRNFNSAVIIVYVRAKERGWLGRKRESSEREPLLVAELMGGYNSAQLVRYDWHSRQISTGLHSSASCTLPVRNAGKPDTISLIYFSASASACLALSRRPNSEWVSQK